VSVSEDTRYKEGGSAVCVTTSEIHRQPVNSTCMTTLTVAAVVVLVVVVVVVVVVEVVVALVVVITTVFAVCMQHVKVFYLTVIEYIYIYL
jgi:hypothetical protein